MYDASDPRAALAPAAAAPKVATEFAGADYAKFYETEPEESSAAARTWYARGQNYVVAYSDAKAGAVFTRDRQVDEYALIIPDAATKVDIGANGEIKTVDGYSIAFIPPGDSKITMLTKGRIVRLITSRSADLTAKCANAASFAKPHPNIPPFEPWPAPPDGFRLRSYSLDVKQEGGRFGRIFRCTTFMINYLEPRNGPRDVTKLSPHFHDDFEQCSLALDGSFIHDIRWPWTTNFNQWRDDDHELCGSPSIAVIPPPAIHTTRAVGAGINQLVDIFSPPRMDFSAKPGWVINAADYPMPAAK
jgi:hypothetical protein